MTPSFPAKAMTERRSRVNRKSSLALFAEVAAEHLVDSVNS
jgi:hypothetical protein